MSMTTYFVESGILSIRLIARATALQPANSSARPRDPKSLGTTGVGEETVEGS